MEAEEIVGKSPRKSHKKGWMVVILIVLTAAVGAGIYFYANHLRKTTSNPVEMVPSNAALVVQVNDYDAFVKSNALLRSYLSDVVSLRALDGMQYFLKQFSQQSVTGGPVVCSAHEADGHFALLLSLRITQKDFDNLLEKLELNDNSCHSYKTFHVYEKGTHFCTFFFCYHDGAFSVSENEDILHASLDCLADRSSIASEKGFTELRGMMDKNPKQNWLVVNHTAFVASQKKNVSSEFSEALASLGQIADWSAYQMTVNSGELLLSGYSLLKEGSKFRQLEAQHPAAADNPVTVVPASAVDYTCFRLSDAARFSTASAASTEAKKTFGLLQSDEIHCFTLFDTLPCRYIAVKAKPDSAWLLALLPEGQTLDSVGEFGCYQFGHGNFAPLLLNSWQHNRTAVFFQQGDYLVFSDSAEALHRYQLAVKNNGVMKDNQLFILLQSDGHWSARASYRHFFQNTGDIMNHLLDARLVDRHTALSKTRCVAFYALKPYQNLIPNHIYIKFSAQ